MYSIIKYIPKNIKLIITNKFIIFISLYGLFFYKLNYYNILYLNNKNKLYCLKLNKKSIYTFKTILTKCLNKNIYGNIIKMKLSGIGFKILIENNNLIVRLGYCNTLKLTIPYNISIKCISKIEFILFSLDFNILMNFCDYFRKLRKPGVYKNYGIYYSNEIIMLKKIKTKKENI